jgi:hypothetical protein
MAVQLEFKVQVFRGSYCMQLALLKTSLIEMQFINAV